MDFLASDMEFPLLKDSHVAITGGVVQHCIILQLPAQSCRHLLRSFVQTGYRSLPKSLHESVPDRLSSSRQHLWTSILVARPSMAEIRRMHRTSLQKHLHGVEVATWQPRPARESAAELHQILAKKPPESAYACHFKS